MNSIKPNALPKPPSLMQSLLAGFDAISNHIGLILFSILLDLILWFGPRVSLGKLLEPFLVPDPSIPELQNEEIFEMVRMTITEFNLMSVLRTFPVGTPSLLASQVIMGNPLGTQLIFEPMSFRNSLLLWVVLIVLGIAIGTFYFEVVAQVAIYEKINWRNIIKFWLWSFPQISLLTIIWFVLLLGLLVPFSCIFSLVIFMGAQLQFFTLIIAVIVGGVLVWLLIPLAFTPHGIFVNHQKVWESMKDSIRIIRLTLPTTSLFLLSAVVLSEGLNILWNVPPEESWWFLVGIIGHAFVTTGLFAASFIYYREADHWSESFIQEVKKSIL
jgi:hypothetical protein